MRPLVSTMKQHVCRMHISPYVKNVTAERELTITNTMQQKPFKEADVCSARQKVVCHFRTRNFFIVLTTACPFTDLFQTSPQQPVTCHFPGMFQTSPQQPVTCHFPGMFQTSPQQPVTCHFPGMFQTSPQQPVTCHFPVMFQTSPQQPVTCHFPGMFQTSP